MPTPASVHTRENSDFNHGWTRINTDQFPEARWENIFGAERAMFMGKFSGRFRVLRAFRVSNLRA
jgi:hypothetical protein